MISVRLNAYVLLRGDFSECINHVEDPDLLKDLIFVVWYGVRLFSCFG